MKKLLVFILMMVGISYGAIIEDFEDGDYTNDPAWIIGNSHMADPVIEADPVRSDNFVVQMKGASQSEQSLIVDLETPQPWLGFNYKEEYFAQTVITNSQIILTSPGYKIDWKTYFNANNKLSSFRLIEGGVKHEYYITEYPDDEWWTIGLSHNIDTNLLTVKYSLLDGTVLTEVSFEPSVDLNTIADITSIAFTAGMSPPQYFDNITHSHPISP